MFPSMEVRWFCAGAIPASMERWFQQCGGDAEDQPGRVDYYLHPAEGDALGIKMREGRLEVKQRQREVGVVRFHERVAGVVEQWRKWSFEISPEEGALANVTVPGPSWIAVTKARRLYRYQLAEDGRVVAVAVTDYARAGCELELTEVRVREQAWWSLGFEAHGDEASLGSILHLVARQILSANEPPDLHVEDSCGYPRWLRLVEQGEAG